VIFADADWMDCADVQIMASNRLLPRSWVSGLLDPKKYTPIRIGRGVWNRKPKIAIPWDEPEAYGTLVHEWGHYALGLRDEYLGLVEGLSRRVNAWPEIPLIDRGPGGPHALALDEGLERRSSRECDGIAGPALEPVQRNFGRRHGRKDR